MTWSRPGASIAALLFCSACLAQPYPARPVKVVVPQPPGGVDTIARIFAQKLSDGLGQPFVVENRAGASGTIGAASVAKAPPDGYTLLINASVHLINPFVMKNVPFDAVKDFTPVTQIGSTPLVVTVHSSQTAKGLAELASGGRLNWAIGGLGSPDHLVSETLRLSAGVPLQIVPYKGIGPAINDLAGGQVAGMVIPILPAAPHLKSGRIRAIAVTSAKRLAGLADVPTLSEAGLPGFELSTWYGLWGPKGLPRDIASKIQQEIGRAIRAADVRQKLPEGSFDLIASTPEDFARHVEQESTKYAAIVRRANITAE